MGFLWSSTRNRLGVEKSKKLATIYRALRPADDVDDDEPVDKLSTAVAEGEGEEVVLDNLSLSDSDSD